MSDNINVDVESQVNEEQVTDESEESAQSEQESGIEALEAGSQDKPEPATQKEVKEAIRKFKLKIDGKEEELSEEEVLKHASMGKAATKRMQEAAQLRKDVETLVEMLKNNPLEILQNPALGVDVKKLFEEYANRQLEEETKSPEQREKEKLQKELEDYKKQALKEKEAREKAEYERLREKAEQDLDNKITGALEKSGLPQSAYVVKRMADYMLLALQNNVNLEPSDIVPIIRKEMKEDLKQFFASSSDDLVEELLTKERISAYRKKALQAAKQPVETASAIKPTAQPKTEDVEKIKNAKKQTIGSWLKS